MGWTQFQGADHDKLRLKRVPIVLGGGTPLFGRTGASLEVIPLSAQDYGNGALFQEFDVVTKEGARMQ